MSNFPTQFCLRNLINLVLLNLEKYLLNGNVYDFSADYNAVDKSDILNIHKYLMAKNNLK